MANKMGFFQKVKATLSRWSKKGPVSQFSPKGVFHIQHFDKEGNLLNEFDVNNGVVNVGLDSILDVYFDAATQITTWYAGLINDPATLAAGDTMASHAGWTEFTTYSEGTRVTIVFEAASGQSIANSVTTADFNITGSGTLHGIFCTSDNVKSGTTGTLWATAPFAAPLSVNNGDLLKVTYTVSAS